MNEHEKKYLNIAMPAAMEGIFMILLCNVDIIVVGTLGTSAIAAVSIFTQPRMIILCFSRSLASAVTLLAAKLFGMDKKETAAEILKQSLFVGAIILATIHIGFYNFLEEILLWMGADFEYINLALSYGKIALLAVFFTSLTAILQSIMLAFGNTKAVLITNLQGNILNIILSVIFIFVFETGVEGAAVGTVIGTIYTFVYTIKILHGDKIFSQGKFIPDKKYFKEILPVFCGVFSEQGFERIGMILYTRIVAELGTIPYAVHSICMNFCDFYYSFAGGLGKANTVLAGQSLGKNNVDDWQKYFKIGVNFGIFFSAISFIATFVFRNEIMSLYSDNRQVIELGGLIMIFVAAVSFAEAHSMICAGILRGSGKTNSVAIYSFVSVTILRPVVTAFFIYNLQLGLAGAWCALFIDQSIRAVTSWILVSRLDSDFGEKFILFEESD